MKKLSTKNSSIIIKIGLILCFVILTSYGFFLNQINTAATIKIEATAMRNQESWGTDVRIHHVRIDQKEVPFQELTFDQGWEYLDDLLVAANPNHKVAVEYTVENAKNLELDLQKHNGSGIVKISANDVTLGEVDLYASDWAEVTFRAGLWKAILLSQWSTFFFIFAVVLLLYIMLVQMALKIKKEDFFKRWMKNIVLPCIILLVGSVFYRNLASGVTGIFAVLLAGVLLFYLHSLCRKRKNILLVFCENMTILLLSSVFLFNAIENINGNSTGIRFEYALGNIGIYFALMLAIYVISRQARIATGLVVAAGLVYGIANYYVTLFRGSPIVPGDFFIIGTAKHILQNYQYTIIWDMFYPVLLLTNWCITVWSIIADLSNAEKRVAFAGFLPLTLLGTCIFRLDFYKPSLDLWDLNNNIKQYGVAMSLISSIRNMKIEAPNDYSYEKVEELYNQYMKNDTGNNFMPNVIAIMNEGYSDLSAWSEILDSESYMPYYNSLKENTIKGRVLVSTIGGGTGNTEYEFLTGNSLAFLPGTVPYQQFVVQDAFSLAVFFRNRGYSTTAIHPFYKSGYNRLRVYPYFGFEEFLDITAFDNPQLSRSYFISDAESYKKVIEVFEKSKKDGKPAFVFNVTIQNHSDYFTGYYGDNTIKVPGFENDFPDVEEYLTLIKESDDAFKVLVEYFSNIQDPTVIVMFGDHQPNVDSKFSEMMFGKPLEALSLEETQKRYEVPFFIWANYDIKEQEDMYTSINYLSGILAREAGIAMTPYQKFLLEMETYVPAININGYMGKDGKWYEITQKSDWSTWIDNYRDIQYNNIFDKRKIEKWFS